MMYMMLFKNDIDDLYLVVTFTLIAAHSLVWRESG